jgi:hypothetical protein
MPWKWSRKRTPIDGPADSAAPSKAKATDGDLRASGKISGDAVTSRYEIQRELIAAHARQIVDAVARTKADHIFVVSRDGKVLDAIDDIVGDKIVRSVRGSVGRELAIQDMELLKSDVASGKKKGISTLQADVTRVDFAEQTSENAGQTAIMIFADLRGLTRLSQEASRINMPGTLRAPEGEAAVLLMPDIARDPSLTEAQREWLKTLPPEQQKRAMHDLLKGLDAVD